MLVFSRTVEIEASGHVPAIFVDSTLPRSPVSNQVRLV